MPYYLHPESIYSVGLSKSSFRVKVSVGSNPWAPSEPTVNLAKVCERYGGGGHARVGAISFGVNEEEAARKAAREIVKELTRRCASANSVAAAIPMPTLQKPLADTVNVPANSDLTILRAEHLGRAVHGKILVEDASFELKKGEVLAITGPSGSGKTSLLRLLNRLDEPTQGTVFVEGTDYRNLSRVSCAANSGW